MQTQEPIDDYLDKLDNEFIEDEKMFKEEAEALSDEDLLDRYCFLIWQSSAAYAGGIVGDREEQLQEDVCKKEILTRMMEGATP